MSIRNSGALARDVTLHREGHSVFYFKSARIEKLDRGEEQIVELDTEAAHLESMGGELITRLYYLHLNGRRYTHVFTSPERYSDGLCDDAGWEEVVPRRK